MTSHAVRLSQSAEGAHLADTTSEESPKVPLPLAVVALTSREACRSRDASCTCTAPALRGSMKQHVRHHMEGQAWVH